MRVCLERLSNFVFVSFPFGFEDGMWDLIILIPFDVIAGSFKAGWL